MEKLVPCTVPEEKEIAMKKLKELKQHYNSCLYSVCSAINEIYGFKGEDRVEWEASQARAVKLLDHYSSELADHYDKVVI